MTPNPKKGETMEKTTGKWIFAPIKTNFPQIIEAAAKRQMRTLSPTIGDVLAFEWIFDELDFEGNWTLRSGLGNVESGEIIIAQFLA